MGSTPPPVLDKHLASLDHLNVMIFREGPIWINVEEGSDAA